MILKSLSLINYKNFDSRSFELDTKINCFVGDNGMGKTNVLDAIYHLSFGKSYFNPITSQNINHEADFFVIEGLYRKNERDEKVIVSAKRNQKKLIKRNGKAYERLAEHIGFLPLVIISPADRDLIIEGSSTRRKFIDGVISQSDNAYLNDLISYGKILSQRNALLKYFAANRTYDPTTLGVYNEQMTALGTRIFKKRNAFVEEFKPIFQERYTAISGGREHVQLKYKSQLSDVPLDQLFEQAQQKDRTLQYTTVGTHKDDLALKIEGHTVKKFGSQGQQKSFLIALKLAQFDFIKNQSGTTPLLLLDDIFDKLDEKRVAQIIKLVNNANFGQLFITDTHPERTEAIVKEIHQSYKIFKL
ncbi:MAG TPA: DNA replication/repair protein RecF [Leeuwenhoekiella sp.]|nr:DNA replication/repair protein RecF [Leeuwenhoekiella sp.]